jgi:hypothetical protein
MKEFDAFDFGGRLIYSKRVKVENPQSKQVVIIEAYHFEKEGFEVGYSIDEGSWRNYGCPKCTRDAKKMVRGLVRRLTSGEEIVKGTDIVRRAA